jgi:uncharacterized membrane protein YbhN (UPF0104 family)
MQGHEQNTNTSGGIRGWMQRHVRLQVVLPFVVAAGLFGYVLSVAVAPRSASQLLDILRQTWLLILLLTAPYLAFRLFTWRQLLKQLGLVVTWHQLVPAFAAGEMTKSIPAGIYTQNYLLSKIGHFNRVSAVRSGAATTATLGLETAVAVPVVLVLGLPGSPWVRWTIIGVVLAWLVVIVLAWTLTHYWRKRLNPERHPWLHRIDRLITEFLEAGVELVTPQTLLALIPTMLYMLVYAIDLHFILHAEGANVAFSNTLVIYAFVVLAVVLIPIPTEIGITEFTGMDALRAYGVSSSTAAIAMLGLRVLATGTTILLAGILLFLTRSELRAAKTVSDDDTGRGAQASQ